VLASADSGGFMPASATGIDPRRAEIFDPVTETWTTTGSLSVARYSHSATLLASGEVLVAGGWVGDLDTGGPLAETEIYSEVTGSFRLAGRLHDARSDHAAILLPSGRALVAGGFDQKRDLLKSAEEFEPPPPVATAPAAGSSGCQTSGDGSAPLLALLVGPLLVRRRAPNTRR
jgi:uncharacterized protein (TIGR03382 family)